VTVLTVYESGKEVLRTDCYFLIQDKLGEFGVGYHFYVTTAGLPPASEKYKNVDMVEMGRDTENKEELRAKFIREHTHSDDEVRWFAKGRGMFGFNFGAVTMELHCKKGDYIEIPAGTKHWFDCGKDPYFRVCRYFSGVPQWVPIYTSEETV